METAAPPMNGIENRYTSLRHIALVLMTSQTGGSSVTMVHGLDVIVQKLFPVLDIEYVEPLR